MTANINQIKQLIKIGAKRTANLGYLGLICGFLMGPTILFLNNYTEIILTFDPSLTDDGIYFVNIFAMVMTLLMFLGVFELWYQNNQVNNLLHLVEKKPDSIVWIYRQINKTVVKNNPLSGIIDGEDFHHLFICTQNRKRYDIWLAEKQIQELYLELQEYLQECSFGYSKEIEQKFQNNPSELKILKNKQDAIKEIIIQTKVNS